MLLAMAVLCEEGRCPSRLSHEMMESAPENSAHKKKCLEWEYYCSEKDASYGYEQLAKTRTVVLTVEQRKKGYCLSGTQVVEKRQRATAPQIEWVPISC